MSAHHDPHPRPTRREVFIRALDTRLARVSLDHLLQFHGIDLTKPYRRAPHDLGEGALSVQDIPPDEAA